MAAARQRQDTPGPVPRAVDGARSRQDAATPPVLGDSHPARGARYDAPGPAESRDRGRRRPGMGPRSDLTRYAVAAPRQERLRPHRGSTSLARDLARLPEARGRLAAV